MFKVWLWHESRTAGERWASPPLPVKAGCEMEASLLALSAQEAMDRERGISRVGEWKVLGVQQDKESSDEDQVSAGEALESLLQCVESGCTNAATYGEWCRLCAESRGDIAF